MPECPHCHHSLSEDARRTSRCDRCGADLDTRQVERDEVSDGSPAGPNEVPAEGSSAATQTVDATDLPDGVSLSSAGDSVDGDFSVQDAVDDPTSPAYSQTVDASHLEDGLLLPETDQEDARPSPSRDPVNSERAAMQTVDAGNLPDDDGSTATSDSADDRFLAEDGEAGRQPATPTVEAVPADDELPTDDAATGPADISRTIDSMTANQTVDMSTPLPTSAPQGGTVDESTGTPPVSPGSKTVQDQPITQTIESTGRQVPVDVGPAPGQGTVDARGPMATVDSSSTPPEGPDDGTVRADQFQKTIQVDGGAGPDIERINQMWGGTVQEQATPQMTIHGAESASETTKSTLVIQQRAIVSEEKGEHDGRADYDLLAKLGQGGMGVVYAARQASIDRTVAVKMLRPEGAADANQRNKFLSEAVITGELEHPNIVPIYDLGRNEENALFYAMKRVQGTPWDDVIKKKSLAENLEIFMKTCDAVAFGHSRGIIHRDLKPENTMLGDYGEVLVMDWGLALPFGKHASERTVTVKASMGGTPAYMAPEMATGPFDKMSPASDIYLLGAILFEIVTGRPPHQGKDVMKCLFAAAKNEIVKTDVTGELVDIAYTAMATNPQDRFATVRDLQNAIRRYQDHSESIAMGARADEELAAAKQTDNYDGYARAMFGYEEAYTLWDGNLKAKQGMSQAKLAYASLAMQKGDLDLALSLLDRQDAAHQSLYEQVVAAQNERTARASRFRLAKQAVIGLIALVLVGGTVGLVAIDYQRSRAVRAFNTAEIQRVIAQQEQQKAETARDVATKAKNDAETAREKAEAEKTRADREAIEAKKQKRRADQERDKARAERVRADGERDNALKQESIAKEEERKAIYETYVALIGLASAKIDENAFDTARGLLRRCKPDLRNWEWGRLQHLCNQSVRDFPVDARVNATAFAPDGRRFVTGSWNGVAQIWETGSDRPLSAMDHDGDYVYAVAWSPTGHQIATGSNSPEGFLRLLDVATGDVVRFFRGHQEPVLSVTFSPDGKTLLSTSLDNTARLWDVQTGRERRPPLIGHHWWVWDAAFSPDGQHVVTASHDGTALVWPVAATPTTAPSTGPSPDSTADLLATTATGSLDRQPGARDPAEPMVSGRAAFSGHTGPVYCVDYSPTGEYVISGGYDKRVLLWRPEDVKPFDYQAMLDRQPVRPKFRELGTHAAAVRSVTFSHDGKVAISAGHDNTIKLWHIETGELLEVLRGHGGWVRDAVFSPDDKWVLSGGYDGRAKLWSIDGYEEVKVLRGRVLGGHADAVMHAAFSDRGDRIVTASRDRSAKIYQTETGDELATFVEGHAFLASTAQFYANGTRLMTAAVDNTVRIWDVASGGELQKFSGTGIAAAAAVSADGQWILTGSQGDQRAKLWDAEKAELVRTLDGHQAEVTVTAFSPDARLLFTGDANGRGVLWDRISGRQLQQLRWHTSKITAAQFLPNGARLLTASDDKTVCQWKLTGVATGGLRAEPVDALILPHANTVWSLDVTRDGRRALTSCEDGRLRFWDLASAKVVRKIEFPAGSLSFARLSPNERTALTVHHQERTVRHWDLRSGREIRAPASNGVIGPLLDLTIEGGLVWTAAFAPDGQAVLTVGGNEARLWSLTPDARGERQQMRFSPHGELATASFSPDGTRVVTASWDMTARVWDAATGRDLLKLSGHKGAVNSAFFSPDGRLVLTASDDGTAVTWDAGSGARHVTLADHGGSVRRARFSGDGTLIVTACEDAVARIWSARDGSLVNELKGHAYGIAEASFSADGRLVITASDDKTARIWNRETGRELVTLGSHTAAVTSVAFSPDGARALTASEDFTAKLWDTNNGREVLNLKGHTQAVTSVSFSRDGRYVLTSSRDGTAIVWLTTDWKAQVPVE